MAKNDHFHSRSQYRLIISFMYIHIENILQTGSKTIKSQNIRLIGLSFFSKTWARLSKLQIYCISEISVKAGRKCWPITNISTTFSNESFMNSKAYYYKSKTSNPNFTNTQ